MGNYVFQIKDGGHAYGRASGCDLRFGFVDGVAMLYIDDETPHQLTEKEVQLGNATLWLQEKHAGYTKIGINGDIRVLRENNYIEPDTVETPVEKAWLAIQEYYLNGDYADEAENILLKALDAPLTGEGLLTDIEDAHPEEEGALNTIFDLVQSDKKIIAAISETKQMSDRLSGHAPAATPAHPNRLEP